MLSGTTIGYMASHKLRMREIFMEHYIKFLSFLEAEIRYSAKPLPNILSKSLNDVVISPLLFECLTQMKQGVSLNTAWINSIYNIPPYYGLNNDDIELLKSFVDRLGVDDIEGQISNCKLNIEFINEHLKNAREEKKKKSKLYLMLGVFGGVSLSLLLI